MTYVVHNHCASEGLAILLSRGHCCPEHYAVFTQWHRARFFVVMLLNFVEGTQFESQQGTRLRCWVFLRPAVTLKCATRAVSHMLSVSLRLPANRWILCVSHVK